MTKIRRNLPNNQYLATLLANSPTSTNVFATMADLAGLGGGTSAASRVQHNVKYGEQINKGQAVYVSSADGTNMIVSKASNTNEGLSSKTMGLVTATGNANYQGAVVTEGLLEGLNTSAAQQGDPVWLGTNGNLLYGLINKPVAPAHLVFIGIVTRVNTNNGEIFVKVQNGFELHELHDVLVPNTPFDNYINKGVLYRDTTLNLWKHESIANLLGYVPADKAFQIITSTPLLRSAVDISGTSITLGIAQASGIADGYLNSTDWNTFNNKVSTTIAINTTAPLTGGGNLSASRTLSLPKATSTVDGYLAATDWVIFNSKQNALGFTPVNKAGDTLTGNIFATNLFGTNTGDETTATIKTKLGAASASQDGYLTQADWSTFNSKGAGTVTNVAALTISTSGLDISSTVANGTSTPVITLVIPTASSTARGALSSTDWSTFNNKVGGSGSIGYLPKFTGGTTLGNSLIQDDGSRVGINSAPLIGSKLFVGAGGDTGITVNASAASKNAIYGSNIGDSAGTRSAAFFEAYPTDTPISTNVYVGGRFFADGPFAYAVQLQDNSEGVGKFLKCITSAGQANWATMSVADTGLTITTTGTSGPATLAGNTLNIPQYTGSGALEKSGSILGTSRSLPFRMATNITTYRSASGVGSTTISSTTFAGESTHYYPISLKEGSPVRAAAFRVNSAGSGGLGTAEMEIGIYNSTTNADGQLIPGTLEVQFGKVSVLSTGIKEAVLASPYTLGATVDNIYWIAIRSYSTNSNSLNIYSTSDVLSSWIGMSSGTAIVKLGMFIATTPYTAPAGLPASLPVTGGVGFTQSATVAGYTANQLLIGLR